MRAAVLRLLWCQHFTTDLATPLSESDELRRAPAFVTGVLECESRVLIVDDLHF
ncbi:hypothetical protein [Streptacidiphilus sp. EB103A]|uniref:hypothetical protein n=1 Tax=Streptacidiphilus sp. EB103A TaxID=3156275 RepID=UPI003513E7B9